MASRGGRTDEEYMREALRLARSDKTLPYPNPWAGCVIVRSGRIVGKGFHRGAGARHAEVEALAAVGARARGATLYVNLEPCCHFGRTPPCTDAVLLAGIRRVVYALRDPNPVVAGRGAAMLKRHGIDVAGGVLEAEAAALNEVYLKYRRTGLPFVTVKIASSLDGKIATRTGDSRWITDRVARRRARALRAEHQAVLVGINTVLSDDPHLGPRFGGALDPWRVVLDSRLRIPTRSRVVATGRCIVATTRAADPHKRTELKSAGAEVWQFPGRRIPLRALLRQLAARGILSLMVEGGGEVLGSFFDQEIVDRVFWFVAPIVIGSQASTPAVSGSGAARVRDAHKLHHVSIEELGACYVVRGNVSRWALAGTE
ncbi:MAG: bifunctional diaminohydroxyphosphoribosylaminopyrimidine deaminase/5-amino-6-(5-phosphoribosylamino)uracil reductase RibD [Terriglobia bacterium]